MQVANFLASISLARRDHFKKSRSILSFEHYLEEVAKNPGFHIRNSAQYFNDMIESFGSYFIQQPDKRLKRYKLFDCDFYQEGHVFGQERVAYEIVSQIKNFVRAGKVDKLLLLHGPNGSAKTTIIQALARAAENYSETESGAIYQFSWVFPTKETVSGSFGFAQSNAEQASSYAELADEAVDVIISSEQADHPLLLLSIKERQEFFQEIIKQHGDIKIPLYLWNGDLSHKNRQIYDALLATYNGNLQEVLRHIRVERFYFSRRYKKGMSVVEPQMSVDAYVRQVTSDQSLQALPSSLRTVSLFEPAGPLVEANRGLIEYSDLLKRPIDAWKYLLVACEQAQVSAGNLSLFFDLLLVATSNELHLTSFKEYPDWPSFKGRIELIRVPYLLRSKEEEGIYQNQIPKALHGVHIAPHAIAMAARWAVLTRLEPPQIQKYPGTLQEIIRDISPDEKLDLYDKGEVPLRLSQRQARELKSLITQLAEEYNTEIHYEGRFGASPREVRTLILNAAQDPLFDHLCVGAVFHQIEQLIEQKSSFEFLRREPVRGYRDAYYLLRSVKNYYLTILEDEARSAIGLYKAESYDELFKRYINHVSAWTKKERLVDPLIGKSADADEAFMGKIESSLLATNETQEEFRRQLISQIGAYKLENPHLDLDYRVIFSVHVKRLKESIYREQRDVVERNIRVFLQVMDGDTSGLDEKEVSRALALKEGLIKLGYNEGSARWAMAYYIQNMFKDGHKEEQPSLI